MCSNSDLIIPKLTVSEPFNSLSPYYLAIGITTTIELETMISHLVDERGSCILFVWAQLSILSDFIEIRFRALGLARRPDIAFLMRLSRSMAALNRIHFPRVCIRYFPCGRSPAARGLSAESSTATRYPRSRCSGHYQVGNGLSNHEGLVGICILGIIQPEVQGVTPLISDPVGITRVCF